MFSRILGIPLLLGAAVGVPYMAANGPDLSGLVGSVTPTVSAPRGAPADSIEQLLPPRAPQPPSPQGPGNHVYQSETPLEGRLSLREALNLQVTQEWVYQRWARKSTALSELGLFGIRVPLVTGTQLTDVAGSLTYFFGNDRRLKRISFRGTTGDTTELVALVTQQHGLRRQTTPVAGEQLFQRLQQGGQHQGQVLSELRTRPAPVLWSNAPHESFAVELDLQSPEVTTPLPARLTPLELQEKQAAQQASQQAAQQAAAQQAADDARQAAKEEAAEAHPEEKWKVFFPRSRVPKQQVDSLERRGQLW